MLSRSGLTHTLSRRRERRRGEELLAAAGAVFDSSLDHTETMRTIAETAVPRLADLCIIDLVRADGTIGDTVAASIDGEAATRLERLRSAQPLDAAGKHPVAQALRSGEAVVIEDLTDEDWIAQIAQSEEHREFIVWAGYRSGVVVPLVARGRLLGALSLLYVAEQRRLDQEDLPLMRDIASRAAMALDNAQLYEERASVAKTLQRSLLPEQLPAIEGLKLASAYHPALERSEVGGDFYDVFRAPSGVWLVVGDVCGKGTDAAAVTALLRHSVRALAFVWSSPARVLGAVNEVMLGHALAGRFATAVVARLELEGGEARATLAGAGHPAPLLVAQGGQARAVELQGMLLGVRPGDVTADLELELRGGETLLLYTDGLLDAGAPWRSSTPQELALRLAKAQRSSVDATSSPADAPRSPADAPLPAAKAPLSPAAAVETLEGIALEDAMGRLRDDVAILAGQVL